MLSITYTNSKTNIWVREKAKTFLNKSEDESRPDQHVMLFNVFHDAAMKYVFKKCGSVLSYLPIIGYFSKE